MFVLLKLFGRQSERGRHKKSALPKKAMHKNTSLQLSPNRLHNKYKIHPHFRKTAFLRVLLSSIFEYGLPNENARPVKYLMAVDNINEKILRYSKNSAKKNYETADKIYVTGENIFDEIKNLKDGLFGKHGFNSSNR